MKFLKIILPLVALITIPVLCFHLLHYTGSNPFQLSTSIMKEVIEQTLKISIPVALIVGLLLFPFIRQQERYQHVSGPEMLCGRSAIKHASHALKTDNGVRGIKVHPKIVLKKQDECGNFFVFGMQGAGKSTIIKYWLNQLIQRTIPILIYDEKREYTELFYDESIVLLSPGDKRSVIWDLSADINDISSARTFSEAIIHQTSNEPFWSDSARLIVTGALMCLIRKEMPWGWKELHNLLFKDAKALQKELGLFFPEAALFADPENKTSASVLAVVSSQLSWVRYLSEVQCSNAKTFSFKNWMNADIAKKVIVQTNPSYRNMSQSLFSAALSMLTNQILALPDCSRREVWLVLDEIAAIPKNDSIEVWLSRCRSKGARTIAGTQSVSQLQSIYGDKDSETILSLFSTVIALRVGAAGHSAGIASQAMGRRRVIITSTSIDSSKKKSVTYSEQEIPVVTAEQLIHVPRPDKKGVTGFLAISGTNAVYELKWPYPELPKIALGFEPEPIEMEEKLSINVAKSKVTTNPFIRGS